MSFCNITISHSSTPCVILGDTFKLKWWIITPILLPYQTHTTGVITSAGRCSVSLLLLPDAVVSRFTGRRWIVAFSFFCCGRDQSCKANSHLVYAFIGEPGGPFTVVFDRGTGLCSFCWKPFQDLMEPSFCPKLSGTELALCSLDTSLGWGHTYRTMASRLQCLF